MNKLRKSYGILFEKLITEEGGYNKSDYSLPLIRIRGTYPGSTRGFNTKFKQPLGTAKMHYPRH